METAELDDLIARCASRRGAVMDLLQDIQNAEGYVPRPALERIAEGLDLPLTQLYGLVTFYRSLRLEPSGRHMVCVCMGTTCHVRGGDIILENFERKLGIQDGETTHDKEFSIERVACVGCCALAPVAIVDETVQGHMAPSKVEGLILGFQIEKERAEREKQGHESGQ